MFSRTAFLQNTSWLLILHWFLEVIAKREATMLVSRFFQLVWRFLKTFRIIKPIGASIMLQNRNSRNQTQISWKQIIEQWTLTPGKVMIKVMFSWFFNFTSNFLSNLNLFWNFVFGSVHLRGVFEQLYKYFNHVFNYDLVQF